MLERSRKGAPAGSAAAITARADASASSRSPAPGNAACATSCAPLASSAAASAPSGSDSSTSLTLAPAASAAAHSLPGRSSARTSHPAAANASHRCDPISPAAPVTSTARTLRFVSRPRPSGKPASSRAFLGAHVGVTPAIPSFRIGGAPRYAPAQPGGTSLLLPDLDSLLLDRSPDFLVVLDGEHKVVRASAGLRSAVPLVAAGQEFAGSLDDASAARLRQGLSIDRDGGGFSLSLALLHRRRQRLLPTAHR